MGRNNLNIPWEQVEHKVLELDKVYEETQDIT